MTVPAADPATPSTARAVPAPDPRPAEATAVRSADMTVFGPVGIDASSLGTPAREVLELTVVDDGAGTTTVAVHGELLQETVPTFADVVADLVDDATVHTLVVDLSTTSFMDSTGLGALVTLHNRVRYRGGAFRLVRPDERVFRLFELTRLHDYFEFVDGG